MSYFLYSDGVATNNIKKLYRKIFTEKVKQNFFVRGMHRVVDKD